MKSINNQRNGFRYGAYSLEILREYATLSYNGGTYKIVMVKTDEDQKYIAIKQYNEVGEFLRRCDAVECLPDSSDDFLVRRKHEEALLGNHLIVYQYSEFSWFPLL